MANTNTEKTAPSMEQILQAIRGVMSTGANKTSGNAAVSEDVLELTEIVPIEAKNEQDDQNQSANQRKEVVIDTTSNILAAIDQITANQGAGEQSKTAEMEKLEADPLVAQQDNKEKDLSIKAEAEKITEKGANKMENNNQANNFAADENAKKANLMSQDAASATADSLKELVKTVAKPASDGLAFRSGMPVEDLVIEIMKPYLREWLDQNLPNIVKSLVEKEIKKLIPRDED